VKSFLLTMYVQFCVCVVLKSSEANGATGRSPIWPSGPQLALGAFAIIRLSCLEVYVPKTKSERIDDIGFAKEGPDADGEDVDAPCARLREIEERRDVDARDCAAGRSGVVDGSVDASPV
jgi:hypothetical protein